MHNDSGLQIDTLNNLQSPRRFSLMTDALPENCDYITCHVLMNKIALYIQQLYLCCSSTIVGLHQNDLSDTAFVIPSSALCSFSSNSEKSLDDILYNVNGSQIDLPYDDQNLLQVWFDYILCKSWDRRAVEVGISKDEEHNTTHDNFCNENPPHQPFYCPCKNCRWISLDHTSYTSFSYLLPDAQVLDVFYHENKRGSRL